MLIKNKLSKLDNGCLIENIPTLGFKPISYYILHLINVTTDK